MAKKKASEEFVFDFNQMAKEVNGVVLDNIEPVSQWIDTGILAFNYISSGKFIGGGMPVGRMVELFGDSASGKSLLAMNILKGCQTMGGVPVLLDAERAISKDFAQQASKIDPKHLIIMEGDTLTECFHRIINVIKKIRDAGLPMDRPIVVVYDSIAASPSDREHAETKIDMLSANDAQKKAAGAGADQPGDRAKICSKYFRLIPEILEKYNATLVVINQFRTKIGVMFGDPNTTPGGRALEYHSSLRFKLRANKTPKDIRGNILGTKITIGNQKNRCIKPFMEARDMYLFFEQGINPFGGLLELLLKESRIDCTSAGNYKVNEPWAGGKEIKFRSSKERNDVPYQTLLECPMLVDADSQEQIEYYIKLYDSAIELTSSGIAEEVDVIVD